MTLKELKTDCNRLPEMNSNKKTLLLRIIWLAALLFSISVLLILARLLQLDALSDPLGLFYFLEVCAGLVVSLVIAVLTWRSIRHR